MLEKVDTPIVWQTDPWVESYAYWWLHMIRTTDVYPKLPLHKGNVSLSSGKKVPTVGLQSWGENQNIPITGISIESLVWKLSCSKNYLNGILFHYLFTCGKEDLCSLLRVLSCVIISDTCHSLTLTPRSSSGQSQWSSWVIKDVLPLFC